MKTQCPNCQASYHIIPEFIGRKTICQICGLTFAIAAAREAEPAPAESAQATDPLTEAARAEKAPAARLLAAIPQAETLQTEASLPEEGQPEEAEEIHAEAIPSRSDAQYGFPASYENGRTEESRAEIEAPHPVAAACFPAALLAKTIRPADFAGQPAQAADDGQPAPAADEPDGPAGPRDADDEPEAPLDPQDADGPVSESSEPAGEDGARPEPQGAAADVEEQPEPWEAIDEAMAPAVFPKTETAPLTADELAASFRPGPGTMVDEPELPADEGSPATGEDVVRPAASDDFELDRGHGHGVLSRRGAAPFSPAAALRPLNGGSWLVQISFGLLGVILGAGLMWLLRPGGPPAWKSADPAAAEAAAAKVAALNEERARLQGDIDRVEAHIDAYPAGSVPRALAVAAREEYGIADALLLQQAAVLETGAKVTIVPPQSRPDPELAGRLEKEIADLTAEIAKRQREAESLADVPRTVAATGIETLNINLGLLKRNYLTAKYGLSVPPPPESSPAAAPGQEAELERLKEANRELRTENEQLKNSAAALYAQALAEVEAGNLAAAADILRRLEETFPDSPLVGPASDTLTGIEIQAAAAETAQKPPVVISSASLKHDGGYFENETQVRIAFQNVSPLVVKQLQFKVLTFDENGLPAPSRKEDSSSGNDLNAVLTENIPPNKADYGLWELSDQVRQVKIKLKQVDFYDAEPWVDESIDEWLNKESGRFTAAK